MQLSDTSVGIVCWAIGWVQREPGSFGACSSFVQQYIKGCHLPLEESAAPKPLVSTWKAELERQVSQALSQPTLAIKVRLVVQGDRRVNGPTSGEGWNP